MAVQSSYWGTTAEVEHIARLCTFTVGGEKAPRQQWLTAYLTAMQLRVEWDNIDRVTVLAYAQQELKAIVKAQNLMSIVET